MLTRVVVIPHSSVLSVTQVADDRVRIQCPECLAETTMPIRDGVIESNMAHDDGCTILARIRRAEARYLAEQQMH